MTHKNDAKEKEDYGKITCPGSAGGPRSTERRELLLAHAEREQTESFINPLDTV